MGLLSPNSACSVGNASTAASRPGDAGPRATAWMHERNVAQTTIDWRFTTADARIKLKRLYPAVLP